MHIVYALQSTKKKVMKRMIKESPWCSRQTGFGTTVLQIRCRKSLFLAYSRSLHLAQLGHLNIFIISNNFSLCLTNVQLHYSCSNMFVSFSAKAYCNGFQDMRKSLIPYIPYQSLLLSTTVLNDTQIV